MENSKSLKTIAKNTIWCLGLIFKLNPWIIISIAVFQLLGSVAPFARNKFFSQVIDSLVYNGQSNAWVHYFVLFILFLIFSSIFMFIQSQLSRILDSKLQGQLRTKFIEKVSGLDYQHLEAKDTSNLISKVDEEFGWRIRQTVGDVNSVFANLVSLATVTVIILPKYPILWFLIFLSQIPQYFIEKYWVQKDWRLHEENSERNKQMWDLNYQLRQKNYVGELRVNNAITYLFQKYKGIWDIFTKQRVDLRVSQSPSEFAMITFSTIVNSICLVVLINDVRLGTITIGLFTFFFQSVSQTSDFFRGLVYSFVSITENSYHIGNFKKVINLENIVKGGDILLNSEASPKIELVDVSFKYPGSKRFVFKDLNLVINPGEEIAIVGANGAGKSTLIKLLCHFYDPVSGKILINGIDLRDIKLEEWNNELSYLAQEFNNYWNLSLRENVVLGKPGNDDDSRVLKALNKADAGFIKKYSEGLDTVMSQRYGGEEPSWGQSQKIAIARVFYRDSPIVILDEPTASIDAVSEYKIFSRLYKEIVGKTLIIVSHRFSTVRNAKRIIVIDKGQIVEQGSHEELIKQKGLYAKSFHLQAKGYS
jgi:ABC-type multidrug transport system fused ATPase/permease subunit